MGDTNGGGGDKFVGVIQRHEKIHEAEAQMLYSQAN